MQSEPRRTSARLRPARQPPPAPQADAGAAAEAAARRARAAERLREVEEPPDVVRRKVRQLAAAVAGARHLVVYTGAGISTAAAIPDYRGPAGVWTRLRRGEGVARVDVAAARPTLTHMALAALWRRGTLRFVVSQNCDGLHLRAGLPRRALAELHGDMFVELCAACRATYLRAFDTTERTARARHRTRRLCHRCGAELRDSIVHFGERGRARWPLNWAGALRHAARADVVLCLGSSLKVLRRYPRLWGSPRRRPRLYIVNLQWTPKDAAAELKISARCDDVMRQLARRLRLRVPAYRSRRDPLYAHHTPLAPRELHTTRRPALRPSSASSASSSPTPSSPSSLSSGASSSDSEDERPLRQLADSLRDNDTDLRTFKVQLRSGEAKIIMRARHAPTVPATGPGRPLPLNGTLKTEPGLRPLSSLRLFRRVKCLTSVNSVGTNGYLNGHTSHAHGRRPDSKSDLNLDWKPEMKPEVKVEAKLDVKQDMKPESKSDVTCVKVPEEVAAVSECVSLARAIIAHAVLVCRASLYPGLHTILAPTALAAAPAPAAAPPAPAPAAAAPAECEWCRVHYSSARCLFYRAVPAGAGGRAGLCACCSAGQEEPAGAAGGAVDPGGGGWYGKGYRKGRPRRRR